MVNFIKNLAQNNIEIKANEDGSFGNAGGNFDLMPEGLEQQFSIKNVELVRADEYYQYDLIKVNVKCISKGKFDKREFNVKFKVFDADPKVQLGATQKIVNFANAVGATGFLEDKDSDQSTVDYLNKHFKLEELNMTASVWTMGERQGNHFAIYSPLKEVKPIEEQETKPIPEPKVETKNDDSIPF